MNSLEFSFYLTLSFSSLQYVLLQVPCWHYNQVESCTISLWLTFYSVLLWICLAAFSFEFCPSSIIRCATWSCKRSGYIQQRNPPWLWQSGMGGHSLLIKSKNVKLEVYLPQNFIYQPMLQFLLHFRWILLFNNNNDYLIMNPYSPGSADSKANRGGPG